MPADLVRPHDVASCTAFDSRNDAAVPRSQIVAPCPFTRSFGGIMQGSHGAVRRSFPVRVRKIFVPAESVGLPIIDLEIGSPLHEPAHSSSNRCPG
jgi:hypothetical protein